MSELRGCMNGRQGRRWAPPDPERELKRTLPIDDRSQHRESQLQLNFFFKCSRAAGRSIDLPVPSASGGGQGPDRVPIPDSRFPIQRHAADAEDAGVLAEDSATGIRTTVRRRQVGGPRPGRSAIGDRRSTASIRRRHHEQLSEWSLPIFRLPGCPAARLNTHRRLIGYSGSSPLSFSHSS